MKVRLGINPLTWSNDDLPSLGADISLETCLTEARAAGYAGVELGNKFPRQAATLRPILQAHGLDLVSGWYSGRLLERDADAEWTAMRAHFELLHALGCKVMVFAEVSRCTHGDQLAPISQRPHLPKGEWQRFGARMTQLAERMQREGLRMAYHHHMGTVVQSAQDIDRPDGEHGRSGRPAAGHRTSDLRRRRSGASRSSLRSPHRARALQGCATRSAGTLPQSRHQLSRCGAGRRFHGTRRRLVDYRSVLAPIARSGYEAGGSSKPSRTRRSRRRCKYAQLGFRICKFGRGRLEDRLTGSRRSPAIVFPPNPDLHCHSYLFSTRLLQPSSRPATTRT